MKNRNSNLYGFAVSALWLAAIVLAVAVGGAWGVADSLIWVGDKDGNTNRAGNYRMGGGTDTATSIDADDTLTFSGGSVASTMTDNLSIGYFNLTTGYGANFSDGGFNITTANGGILNPTTSKTFTATGLWTITGNGKLTLSDAAGTYSVSAMNLRANAKDTFIISEQNTYIDSIAVYDKLVFHSTKYPTGFLGTLTIDNGDTLQLNYSIRNYVYTTNWCNVGANSWIILNAASWRISPTNGINFNLPTMNLSFSAGGLHVSTTVSEASIRSDITLTGAINFGLPASNKGQWLPVTDAATDTINVVQTAGVNVGQLFTVGTSSASSVITYKFTNNEIDSIRAYSNAGYTVGKCTLDIKNGKICCLDDWNVANGSSQVTTATNGIFNFYGNQITTFTGGNKMYSNIDFDIFKALGISPYAAFYNTDTLKCRDFLIRSTNGRCSTYHPIFVRNYTDTAQDTTFYGRMNISGNYYQKNTKRKSLGDFIRLIGDTSTTITSNNQLMTATEIAKTAPATVTIEAGDSVPFSHLLNTTGGLVVDGKLRADTLIVLDSISGSGHIWATVQAIQRAGSASTVSGTLHLDGAGDSCKGSWNNIVNEAGTWKMVAPYLYGNYSAAAGAAASWIGMATILGNYDSTNTAGNRPETSSVASISVVSSQLAGGGLCTLLVKGAGADTGLYARVTVGDSSVTPSGWARIGTGDTVRVIFALPAQASAGAKTVTVYDQYGGQAAAGNVTYVDPYTGYSKALRIRKTFHKF